MCEKERHTFSFLKMPRRNVNPANIMDAIDTMLMITCACLSIIMICGTVLTVKEAATLLLPAEEKQEPKKEETKIQEDYVDTTK